MRNRQLAIGVAAALSIGLLARPAIAQAPTPPPFNPPVTNCNTTGDTTDDNHKIATTIDAKLLTSGQPCQQRVNTVGLTNSGLDNLQRGFDFYSWLTFLALNSPADGKIIGQGSRPGGDATTRWEVLSNYRQLADVMLANGSKPDWGTRIVPDLCKPLDGPGKIDSKLGEAAWNQPFKTGPLIDQNGNYAVFDILMNEAMFRLHPRQRPVQQARAGKLQRQHRVSRGSQPGHEKRQRTDGLRDAEGILAHPRSGQGRGVDKQIPHSRRLDLFSRPAPERRRHQGRSGLRRKETGADRFPRRPQDEVRAAMGVELVRTRRQLADPEAGRRQGPASAVQLLQSRLQAEGMPDQPYAGGSVGSAGLAQVPFERPQPGRRGPRSFPTS